MAATGEDEKTKVKDDDSMKEKKFGQKTTKDGDGTEVPVDDENAAKAS